MAMAPTTNDAMSTVPTRVDNERHSTKSAAHNDDFPQHDTHETTTEECVGFVSNLFSIASDRHEDHPDDTTLDSKLNFTGRPMAVFPMRECVGENGGAPSLEGRA